jgi:hypothetical protein
MPRYQNGRAPLSELVKLGDQHYLPTGTAARWKEMQRLAWEKYGVWLLISPGWNAYRPLNIQVQYREELGIWAAVPGYSSHGLVYLGRDCAAIDVFNWRSLAPGNEILAWSRFVALCRLVGFTVDFVTPREQWHIGDFDPFTIPAFASIVINPDTTATPVPEEDEMQAPIIAGRDTDGAVFSIPMGGKVWQYPDVDTYNRHRGTLAVLKEKGWPVVVPPALAEVVMVNQDRLNDLILAQGAWS